MKKLLAMLLTAALLTSCSTHTEIIGSADAPTDIIVSDKSTGDDQVDSGENGDTVDDSKDESDTSELSEMDSITLQLAQEAIDEFYNESMTKYEICIAAHDWIVTHITYDSGALNILGNVGEYSDTAYGALTTGEAICSGYADTFKLFMDLLGIENVLVIGQSNYYRNNLEDHRWNMVCIDENWYHFDCTWDDYVPDDVDRPAMHIYTFLSDADMEFSSHVWDKDEYPTAESNVLNYYKQAGLYLESASEVYYMLDAAEEAGDKYLEIAVAYPFSFIMTKSASEFYTELYDYYVIVFEFD